MGKPYNSTRPHPFPRASMGQNHGNVHPDLIRSPVHPWAKTMITSTQTSSVPQSIHGSLILLSPTVTLSHPGLILSPEHLWVNRPHPGLIRFPERPRAKTKTTSIQTSSFPSPESVPRSICRSTVSIHGPTMITSTQTSSFPQSIHSPTVISTTQTSSAQKANGTYDIMWLGLGA